MTQRVKLVISTLKERKAIANLGIIDDPIRSSGSFNFFIIINDSCNNHIFCLSALVLRFCDCNMTTTRFGSYNWSESKIGDGVLQLPCELNPEYNASRKCGKGGAWKDIDYSQCKTLC